MVMCMHLCVRMCVWVVGEWVETFGQHNYIKQLVLGYLFYSHNGHVGHVLLFFALMH